MYTQLKLIVFVSCASPELDADALSDLLHSARRSNSQCGIAGVMLHEDGDIMQALEGPSGAVDEIFSTIRHDRRHTGVILLHDGACLKRAFPDWPMGFGSAIEGAQRDGDPGARGPMGAILGLLDGLRMRGPRAAGELPAQGDSMGNRSPREPRAAKDMNADAGVRQAASRMVATRRHAEARPTVHGLRLAGQAAEIGWP